MSDLVEAIRAAVKNMIRPDLVIGKITKFNSDEWTVDVELNEGSKVDQVTIRSVLNNGDTGIFIEPKVGSFVLCALNDGKIENLSVVLFSEIENMKLLPKEELILRGDAHGGVPIVDKIQENLDKLSQAITTIKNALPGAFSAIGAGSAANGAAGASAFQSATSSINIQFQDMENKKVKHG